MFSAILSWIIADEVVLKSIGLIVGGSIFLAFAITVGIWAVKWALAGIKLLWAIYWARRLGGYDRKHK